MSEENNENNFLSVDDFSQSLTLGDAQGGFITGAVITGMYLHVEALRTDDGSAYNNEDICYATDGSAAIDLRSTEDVSILPGETHLISTGLAINLAGSNLAGLVLPRSGRGHKEGLILGNGVGLIDSDYQGTIMVSAYNRNPNVIWNRQPLGADSHTVQKLPTPNETPIEIKKGEKFAQLMIVPFKSIALKWVDEFTQSTDRGTDGVGSTGNW